MNELLTQLQSNPAAWAALGLAYLLGAVPFGLIITKVFLGYDVRTQGSGNIGMTNVMRTGGKLPGIATFLLDFSKGLLPVMLAEVAFGLPSDLIAFSAVLAVLGHTRSLFLGFKGGKGVATNFGVWAWLDWRVFVLTALTWALVFVLKRISSLSALCALLLLAPLAYLFNGAGPVFAAALAMALYIITLHYQNILRLVRGEEGRLQSKDTP